MIDPQSVDSVLLLSQPKGNQWDCIIGAMKPGAHLLLFSEVNQHHLGAIAAEDIGLEIRDTLAYVYADGENGVAMRLIAMARKPLDGTVAENVLKWGTGGLNIDKCRVGTESRPVMVRTSTVGENSCTENPTTGATSSGEVTSLGRWSANLLHCGSPIVQSLFPDTGISRGGNSTLINVNSGCYNWNTGDKKDSPNGVDPGYGDSGSASRFFYSAPTLNTLIEYLLKLITPPGGTILTSPQDFDLVEEAAKVEGFTVIKI